MKKLDKQCLRSAYDWALFLAGDKSSPHSGERMTFGQATQNLYAALRKSGYGGDLYTRTAREPRFRSIARDLYAFGLSQAGWNVVSGEDFSPDSLAHTPKNPPRFDPPKDALPAFLEAAHSLLDGMVKRAEGFVTHSQLDYAARKHSLPPSDLAKFLASRWGVGVSPRGKVAEPAAAEG